MLVSFLSPHRCMMFGIFFFFKQKTAYEMRISDWSSDVCSSDLAALMWSCQQKAADLPAKEMDPTQTAELAATIEKQVSAELDSGLTLKFWGIDSLVISPIAFDIDDHVRLFYTPTDRQKTSQFHNMVQREWEITITADSRGGKKVSLPFALMWSLHQKAADLPAKEMDPTQTAELAATIEKQVSAELDSGLTLKLWGIDSLVISPIAIDIDDHGRLFYTTTDRQKNSEFDIRGHRDWEIPSISFKTVEDRRAFLREELSPENSARNTWLADLNGDGSHDWRDLTIEKEKVYRVEDISGDGVADRSQLVVDDFHEEITDVAGGVFADGDDLYLAVAPDLWRLTDTNGDGIPDKKTSKIGRAHV